MSDPGDATSAQISPASRVVNHGVTNSSLIDPLFTLDPMSGMNCEVKPRHAPKSSGKMAAALLGACVFISCFLVKCVSISEIAQYSNDASKIPGRKVDSSGLIQPKRTVFDDEFIKEFDRALQSDSLSVFTGHKNDGFIPFVLHNGTLLCRQDHRDAIRQTTRIRAVAEMINIGLQMYQREKLTHKVRREFPFLLLNSDGNGCIIKKKQDHVKFPRFTWSSPSHKYGADWCRYAIPAPSYFTWKSFHKEHTSHSSWKSTFATYKKQYPWATKINKAVWRGATTYDPKRYLGLNLNNTPRGMLVQKGMEHPDLIDAGFVKLIQQYENMEKELTNQTILTECMKFDDQMNYKAILDIDGNNWSARFPKLLCSNSVVIKVRGTMETSP